jgi:HD-like signal output (HDOD) protein
MANRPFTDVIRELSIADHVSLPFHPGLAREIPACLAAEGPDSKRLWSLTGQDPALLCHLFRAANAFFFAGLPRTVFIEEAVNRLGSDKAAEIITQVCLTGRQHNQGPLLLRYLPDLWRHARGCALGARWLAIRCGYRELSGQAYLAGMLHDIGKHCLLAAMEEGGRCGTVDTTLPAQLVVEVLATMHIEQGTRLLEQWGLAEIYINTVADHHDDRNEPRDSLIALVKLANNGCRKLRLGLLRTPELVLSTSAEAQFLGIDEIALAEFEIMLEDRFLIEHTGT